MRPGEIEQAIFHLVSRALRRLLTGLALALVFAIIGAASLFLAGG